MNYHRYSMTCGVHNIISMNCFHTFYSYYDLPIVLEIRDCYQLTKLKQNYACLFILPIFIDFEISSLLGFIIKQFK